ncbi:periplasmic heavy metal sensor [Pseudorhodobacter turbinis]|uniref:Periplasmic heavy metal sensor n=1 Tax=Pseudorhodobacter turbinis TaxID=2500533 RepID=A0A4P8EHX0_9RHOB|nr:periplasmic heavy metal sensor [Pseudorhodobacter turbinis]QCO56363.1 periplasmic heavy metal sensor [Pseudorhodobacter turbinis]
MTDNHAPTPPKPPFRWGRLVLFTSLALNLAVAGVIGGAALGGFGHKRAEFVARDIGFGIFGEALTKEDRTAIRRSYGKVKKDVLRDRQQMRDDLHAMLAALRADPFELEVLKQALDAGAARIAERQALGQTLLLERISNMSEAERTALADRLEEAVKRKPKRDRPRPEPN